MPRVADRGVALQETARLFPELLPWVTTCYSQPSHLLFGIWEILSCCGFHQGDPLASLLFCLVLHPLILRIQEEVPTLALNSSFLDDMTLIGTLEELGNAVDILLADGPVRGLHLSTAATVTPPSKPKTTLWSPLSVQTHDDPLNRGIPVIREEGVVLLGAPLGSENFVGEVIRTKIDKIRQVTSLLPDLQDPHTEFALLRSCLALPKLLFLLRTVDTTPFQHLLAEFDSLTREALTRILGSPIPPLAVGTSQAPCHNGRYGFESCH